MADNNLNVGIFIEDLLEDTVVEDTDLLIIEDKDNTKKIIFRNLRISLINDEDTASPVRIYSSKKVEDLVNASRQDLDIGLEDIKASISELQKYSVTKSELQEVIKQIEESKVDHLDLDKVWEELSITRKKSEPITSKDLAYGTEDEKIHLKHLGSDILDAMCGSTAITPPAIPLGGWTGDDMANHSISALKLKKDFLFRGSHPEGDLNRDMVFTGVYEVASTVTGMPHYGDDYDETRLVEVLRYGVDAKYIVQRVYYKEYSDEIRPYFERKGLFAKLSILEFTAHFEFSDRNKIEASLLSEHYANRGTITEGNIFDLTEDGNYLCEKSVINLPTRDRYLLNIRSFGNRREFEVKKADITGCITYSCYEYNDSNGFLQRTEWYNTENIEKSKFDGKVFHLYGDGIAWGNGSSDPLITSCRAILHKRYGYEIYSHALKEATIGHYEHEEYTTRSVIKQINDTSGLKTDKDMFAIIFAGSEDYISGRCAIGQDNSDDDTTFKGSINVCIKNLLERQPKCKMLLVTPIYRASYKATDNNNSDDTILNGKTLRDFADAIVEVGNYNHIPVLNLYDECMINKYTANYYLCSDGIYPNDMGQELLAEKIHDGMCRFY